MSQASKNKKQALRKERIRQQKHQHKLASAKSRAMDNNYRKAYKSSRELFAQLEGDISNLIYEKVRVVEEMKHAKAGMQKLLDKDPVKYHKITTDGCDKAMKRIVDELEPKMKHLAQVVDTIHDQGPGEGRMELVFNIAGEVPETVTLFGDIMAEYNDYAQQMAVFAHAADHPETNPAVVEPESDTIQEEDSVVERPDVEVDVDVDEVNQVLEEMGDKPIVEDTPATEKTTPNVKVE
jgi:hypothetical protein